MPTIRCDFCGKEYFSKKEYKRKTNFCNRVCYNKFREGNRKVWQCINCGRIHESKKGQPIHDFCDRKCWFEWHRGKNHQQHKEKILIRCDFCGKEIYKSEYNATRGNHNYCSRKCSDTAHSIAMRGKGGNKPTGKKFFSSKYFYSSTYWRRIREKILERDDRKCVICGMTEQEHIDKHHSSLHVDHIIPRKDGGTEDENNLHTLCCHHHCLKTGDGL